MASYIIHQLVELPENAAMSRYVDWYIMPVMNPDGRIYFIRYQLHTYPRVACTYPGYEYSHTDDRMWRKTRSKSPNSSCVGADPNRNFGFKWNGKGTSRDPCDSDYAGKRAFSEPEMLAVSKFLLAKADQLQVKPTLHESFLTLMEAYVGLCRA